MNHSPATGVPDAPGSRRARWIALGAIAFALVLIGGFLLYLSPVLALLEPHDQSPGRVARATVEKAFKIPIHYYAWVGLNGLVRVVDRVGGIDLDVLHPVLDDNYPNDFSDSGYGTERVYLAAGPQHLDGRHALQYVRSRHGDLLSDFGRSIRQQQVLLALQQRAEGMDLVTALPSFARDLNGHVKTDLDLVRVTQLGLFMRSLGKDDVRQAYITPYVRDATSPDGQQILLADWPAVNRYLRQLFGGDLLP